MERSSDRILTTHVGSLPRSERLLELLVRRNKGEEVDEGEFRRQVAADMEDVVRRQLDAGIDIGGDGELPRIGFSFYVKDRMSGFGGVAKRGTVADMHKFPGYAALRAGSTRVVAEGKDLTRSASMYDAPEAQGEVRGDPELRAASEELAIFAAALEAAAPHGRFRETFVTAATPGIVTTTMLRAEGHPVYATDRDYLFAVAREQAKEYALVVEQGHVLQLDAPDLAMERQIMFQDRPLVEFLERAELHVEAINMAIEGLPRDRVRLHVCWGNWDGPHMDDVDLADVLPILYAAKVGALSLAGANPRHQHDWKQFARHPLPAGMLLIPGVIDVTTNYLEHPEVVADRICAYAGAVGDPTRIVACTDCGFSTFAGYVMVAPDVAWKKLETLAEGARLATERLFG